MIASLATLIPSRGSPPVVAPHISRHPARRRGPRGRRPGSPSRARSRRSCSWPWRRAARAARRRGGLEGAVVVRGLAPRHVGGGRDVAGALGLLLREVGGGEQSPGELVGAAHVDEVLGADRGDDLVAERPDARVLLLRGVRRTLA